MGISRKDSKRLWAKSGNRCAICKEELVRTNKKGIDYIVGEECHIISSKPNGPRHEEGLSNYDKYDNLILLCSNHHKEIDAPCNLDRYSKDELYRIKKNHELWSRNTCRTEKRYFKLITTGSEFLNLIDGVYTIYWRETVLEYENSVISLIKNGISNVISDYLLLGEDIDNYFSNILHEMLMEFSEKGIFLYGRKQIMSHKSINGIETKLHVAVLDIRLNKIE